MSAPVVGIIGAGQLARMTAQAAVSLGVCVHVLATRSGEPACAIADAVDYGDPDDPTTIRRFVRSCDVVTFDHERVLPATIEMIEAEGCAVQPSSSVMRCTDKAHQRRLFHAHGLPVPPFAEVRTAREIDQFALEHAWPVVAKTTVGGYDGRGVFVLDGPEASASLVRRLDGRPMVVEPHLAIEAELAVVVARRISGETRAYPTVETMQVDGICRETITPPRVPVELDREAVRLAVEIADTLGAVGVLAVEFFVTDAGLLINEIAPRPHNSGHWTIEGAVTSQFENHLRGILDWPLGDTALTAPAVAMVNVLGQESGVEPIDGLPAALSVPAAHVHLYAKAARPGRKLGHVTATGSDRDIALDRARRSAEALTDTSPLSSTRQGAHVAHR